MIKGVNPMSSLEDNIYIFIYKTNVDCKTILILSFNKSIEF